jgi:hypothetical protein
VFVFYEFGDVVPAVSELLQFLCFHDEYFCVFLIKFALGLDESVVGIEFAFQLLYFLNGLFVVLLDLSNSGLGLGVELGDSFVDQFHLLYFAFDVCVLELFSFD